MVLGVPVWGGTGKGQSSRSLISVPEILSLKRQTGPIPSELSPGSPSALMTLRWTQGPVSREVELGVS